MHLADERLCVRARSLVVSAREQNRGRLVAAVHHESLDRLALDQRLGVGQERHQFLQPFGAAEFTQQVRRRASDLPVRRIHQLLDGLAALRAESKEHVAKPTTGARVLFARERFGQRGDDGRAHRVTDPLEPLVAFVVGTAQVRGDVLHHRAAAELLERRARVRLPLRIGAALVEHRFGELPRRDRSSRRERDRPRGATTVWATSRQRSGSSSMTRRSMQQLVIEPAQRRVADGAQPRRDAFGRIVAGRSTSTARSAR